MFLEYSVSVKCHLVKMCNRIQVAGLATHQLRIKDTTGLASGEAGVGHR